MTEIGLRTLVIGIEERRLPETDVWLFLPGGVLTGTVITRRRFIEETCENLAISREDPETGQVNTDYPLSEASSKVEIEPDPEPEILYLFKPGWLTPNGVCGLSRLAQVRLEDVSAWGLRHMGYPK